MARHPVPLQALVLLAALGCSSDAPPPPPATGERGAFGRELRLVREAEGLTRADLVERVSAWGTADAVYAVEAGDAPPPATAVVRATVRALGGAPHARLLELAELERSSWD